MEPHKDSPRSGKRLSAPFILCGLLGICAVVVGLTALERKMRTRRDRQTLEWAERAMKEGRYGDAAAHYAAAVARHPQDAALSLRSGDALYALSASRPETLERARVAWQAAARIEPNNLAALRRLLQFQADWAEVRPSLASFAALDEIAARVVAISPGDKDAAAARQIALLAPWFSEDESRSGLEADAHDKLRGSLGELARSGGSDERVVLYYALACSRRAMELVQSGTSSTAHKTLDDAESDVAQAGDSGPLALFRRAEALAVLAEANQRIDRIPESAASGSSTTRPTAKEIANSTQSMWPMWDSLDDRVRWAATDPAKEVSDRVPAPKNPTAVRCWQQARSLAARAAQSAPPADLHWVDIRLLEAHLARATDDPGGAAATCLETLTIRPASLRVELALAELIADSHPQEAMAVLDVPADSSGDAPGPFALARRELLVRAAGLNARLHLDAAASAEDAGARQANLAKANAACDALAAMLVSDGASLKLTGRLRMLQGRHADAVRLLDRAAARGAAGTDLLYFRATSLLALHETQAAIEDLQTALELDASCVPERMALAQALIAEGRLEGAAKQLDLLEKGIGSDQRVLALRVRFLAARIAIDPNDATAKRLHEVYEKLLEQDAKQMVAKAELALVADQPADAVRLVQLAQRKQPSSASLAAELVRVYLAAGKSDLAGTALANALASHSGDAALVAVQKSLVGPVSLDAYEASLSGQNAREFLAAIRSCRVALESRELPAAREQIDIMARLRSDEPLLFDSKFRYDLLIKKWADAELSGDRLAEFNFDRMEGLSYRFQVRMARGQFSAAAAIAKDMTLRHPQFVAGWIDYARALQAMGQYDRAMDASKNAVALENENVDAIKALAQCLQAAGRMEEADAWIARGRTSAPADADFREMDFARQLSQGDPHRLILTAETDITNESQQSEHVIALARVYLQINRLEALSDPAEARGAARKAVALLNDAMTRLPDDQACSFWAAHASAVAGDVAGGKQILRRLCDRAAWSRRPEAEQMLADFCLTWGDPKSAEVALRQAIARGAGGVQMSRELAAVLMRRGSWQAADDVLKRYRSDPLVQEQQIKNLVSAGQGPAVESDLQAAFVANPHDARIMSLLGVFYATGANVPEARFWLDRAIAAGDEQLASRARGALALREGRADLATIAELATAHEADPSDSGVAILLSDACLRNQDAAHAERALESALSVNPSDTEIRLALISLLSGVAPPDWERIAGLIEAGHLLAPSSWDWDAAEARMWMARHEPAKAAALMRHAVQLTRAMPEVADTAMEGQGARQYRELIPIELRMLLAAHADDAVLVEANGLIPRYGPRDLLSAWAHFARATVQRRRGSADGGAAEYVDALATAQAAGGYPAGAGIAEAISAEAGADEAVRRINAYMETADRAAEEAGGTPTSHDPNWDLLRIDLLTRNNQIHAAAGEIDRVMPGLAGLPPASQVALLRTAVVVYLSDASSQLEKARGAAAALLKRSPQDPWALNNLAIVYLEGSRPSEFPKALEFSRQAYQLAGRGGDIDPRIADTYGWALARVGHATQALDVLGPVAHQLDAPEVQLHLAEAYLAAASPLSAWPHLQAAVRLMGRDQRRGSRIDPFLRKEVANTFWRTTSETARQALDAGGSILHRT